MQSYPLAEVGDRSSELFNQAAIEPVLLTEASKPEFVILSVQNYQQLINRLSELEDRLLGQQAEEALQQSSMVGSDVFLRELQQIAAIDRDSSAQLQSK